MLLVKNNNVLFKAITSFIAVGTKNHLEDNFGGVD